MPPEGDLIEPAARVGRNAGDWPLRRRRDQRLLHRVLGGGEVAVTTRNDAEHLRRELAQQVQGGGVQSFGRQLSLLGGALIT